MALEARPVYTVPKSPQPIGDTMSKRSFLKEEPRGLEARYLAQKIVFGPVVFQAARIARDSGMLRAIEQAGKSGLSAAEVAAATSKSAYAVAVVCEPLVAAGVLDMEGEGFVLTKVGHFLLNDELTTVNMSFVQDVCYEGLADWQASLESGKPEGLKRLGSWPTIYDALAHLPGKVQESWFAFDHLYSDSAFPEALEVLAAAKPRRLLDIGANTGKWSMLSARAVPGVEVTLADLPGQLAVARRNFAAAGLEGRARFFETNILAEDQELPTGFDVVWMSQFLVCFSEAEVVRILRKAARALGEGGRIYVLDNFWDLETNDIAAYCIAQTTPYFTALANGNSRMYRYADLERLIEAAELRVESRVGGLGLGHTLLELKPS
jgi:ubiquinone/menaquinone biosynthesis C-methylase UbiE